MTPTVVAWCEDGQEKTWTCQDGQSCKWNEGIGAFDCVAGGCEYDLDGDGTPDPVPATGACASPLKVVWCEAGELRKLKCGPGSTCAWNGAAGDSGATDCVDVTTPPGGEDAGGTGGQDASSPADAQTSDEDAGEADGSGSDGGGADGDGSDGDGLDGAEASLDGDTGSVAEPPPSAPDTGLRPVQYDDTGAPSGGPAISGGCQAGPTGATPWALALVALALSVLRRRAAR